MTDEDVTRGGNEEREREREKLDCLCTPKN